MLLRIVLRKKLSGLTAAVVAAALVLAPVRQARMLGGLSKLRPYMGEIEKRDHVFSPVVWAAAVAAGCLRRLERTITPIMATSRRKPVTCMGSR